MKNMGNTDIQYLFDYVRSLQRQVKPSIVSEREEYE